jgi:uncharacterized membrane protein
MVLELAMAWLLRIGVGLSASVLTVGLLLRLNPWNASSMAALEAEIQTLRSGALLPPAGSEAGAGPHWDSFAHAWEALLTGDPNTWMSLGLLLLLAVPMARVAFAALLFIRDQDWIYTGLSLIVLALLLYGLKGV